jgi:hypothetical protein
MASNETTLDWAMGGRRQIIFSGVLQPDAYLSLPQSLVLSDGGTCKSEILPREAQMEDEWRSLDSDLEKKMAGLGFRTIQLSPAQCRPEAKTSKRCINCWLQKKPVCFLNLQLIVD